MTLSSAGVLPRALFILILMSTINIWRLTERRYSIARQPVLPAIPFSAGGPIVNPHDVMIITPICPHLLHHRSVIVSSSERVSVHPWTKQADIQLIVDGQIVLTLQDNDIVQITRSPLTTQLIELQGTDFYTLLHHKLSKVISREPERM